MATISTLPTAEDNLENAKRFRGVARILGPKWARMPIINIGMLGVMIYWSLEMSYVSPYLLSLGLSKSKMAIVLIVPPWSGLLVQPLIGALADSSTSSSGRRRPFILGATLVCVVAMLLMGFTRSFASIFTGWNNSANDMLTIWLAVLSFYVADFSISAVQTSDRALIVDTLPSNEQPAGNAWTGRMQGIGSVLGFFVGNIDLPKLFPVLGDSQLKVLVVLLSIVILSSHLVTCVFVKERVLLKSVDAGSGRTRLYKEFKDIWGNMRTLPRVIRQIFMIQLFSWIAWFPILFYSTIYISELHKRNSPPPSSPQDEARLDAEALRLGSRALLYSSLVSLVGSAVLPAFTPKAIGSTSSSRLDPVKNFFSVPLHFQVHLSTMWAIGQLMLGLCMFSTIFTDTVRGATLILIAMGIPGALPGWAPHALLAQAILTESPVRDNALSTDQVAAEETLQADGDGDQEPLLIIYDEDGESRVDPEQYAALSTSPISERPGSRNKGAGTLSAKAGIILAIHNAFTVIPQFIVTMISSVLFALLDGDVTGPRLPGNDEPRAEKRSNSLVYVFCIGGLSAVYSFVLCWRLSRDLRHRY